MTGPTLLLVDPHDGSRTALADLLRDLGYAVLEARDGAEGFGVAHERRPGLVIADPWRAFPAFVRMVEELRGAAATRDVAVLALTAQVTPEDRDRALAAGCVDCLEKPCAPEQVLMEVRRILGPAPSAAAAHPRLSV